MVRDSRGGENVNVLNYMEEEVDNVEIWVVDENFICEKCGYFVLLFVWFVYNCFYELEDFDEMGMVMVNNDGGSVLKG